MTRWRVAVLPALVVLGAVGFAAVTLIAGDHLPDPIAIDAAGPAFSSVAEMTEASDLVVEGTIVSSDVGRRITDTADPDAGVVTRLYELEIVEVFRGTAVDQVLIEQEDTLLDGSPIVVNGLSPHQVGQRGFWFLVSGETEEFPFNAVVNEQGRLLLSAADTIESSLFVGTADADDLRVALRAAR